jgi:hypothetical protein
LVPSAVVPRGRPTRWHRSGAAFLHVAVAHFQVLQDRAQLAQIRASLGGSADIGLADDLEQRDAGAVVVDQAGVAVLIVNVLAGVLLHVDAREADRSVFAIDLDVDATLGADRQLVLADLIALGQVRVEVVLARPAAHRRDRAVRRQSRP